MKFIGIIPARYRSSRFPGKALKVIDGKSMIERVFEQAAKALDEVWIATDDQRIADAVSVFYGIAVMTTDKPTCGTDRCIEVINKLHDTKNLFVINIQGDQPYIDPGQIKTVVDNARNDNTILTLMTDLPDDELDNPNTVKVILDTKGNALSFSRKAQSWDVNYKHIGVYGYSAATLKRIEALPPFEYDEDLEQLKWLDAGMTVKCLYVPDDCIAINVPGDLIKAQAHEIFKAEAAAIRKIPLSNEYEGAVSVIHNHVHAMGGKLITSGMGKAGQVAHDIATTFCSTGTQAIFLHPAEAQHGDLGIVNRKDVFLFVSNSGETRELIELWKLSEKLCQRKIPVVLICGNRESTLWQMASVPLFTGRPDEVCPMGVTPTTSTTVMNVIGDVLVVLMMQRIGFTTADYALRHHGGYLGSKLNTAIPPLTEKPE